MRAVYNFSKFELITRFSMGDFALNLSSLDALRFCVTEGATVFGVKDLHSKVYLFDERRAIVSSANLTNGGLIHNLECGLVTDDSKVIQELQSYFEKLKSLGGKALTVEMCDEWQATLDALEIVNGPAHSLPDFGASEISVDNNRRYYVKFLGTSLTRLPLETPTREVIESALCHYAVGFSYNKKPRRINDNDVIYIARMTNCPNDYSVFGKAYAIRFNELRDTPSPREIEERPWKRGWPYYLRIKSAEFIDGRLGDGVLLYDLIKALDYEAFATTKERYTWGERNINPYRSLSQQPYIQLSSKGAEWLEARFQESLRTTKKISRRFLNGLPQPDPW